MKKQPPTPPTGVTPINPDRRGPSLESESHGQQTTEGAAGTAAAWIPDSPTLPSLREAAAQCRGCHLFQIGTQTVFGEGPPSAELMLVGEQPGDMEDRTGRPFVGPAGRLLDESLEFAGIDRAAVYVTNVVKHFKWEPRGKRRIHSKPVGREISACRPWLDTEIALLKPRGIMCLGATAAQALLGRDFRVSENRGERIDSPLAPLVMATVHPSALLRMPDEKQRRIETERFISDLRSFAAAVRE